MRIVVCDDEKYFADEIEVSFADVKQTNYPDAVRQIKRIISKLYRRYPELEKCRELTSKEKEKFYLWNEFTEFLRGMFHATFKTNPYLYRAIMTGITRVSNESMFSDLNHLNVITVTSKQYATCFGFTEEEVFQALDDFEMSEEKGEVKRWYDGFVFGGVKDIYNPWSITNFLKERMIGQLPVQMEWSVFWRVAI